LYDGECVDECTIIDVEGNDGKCEYPCYKLTVETGE
jgi:hypothetical protein